MKSVKEEVIGIQNLPTPSTADIISTIEMSDTDSSISLPTPLLDTWIVTPSSAEERAIFQAQVSLILINTYQTQLILINICLKL